MSNCFGLKALERITELKEVSMFTLIHLAKDNGLNLYFCKVEPDELVKVSRPAIFHQKNHFVFVDFPKAIKEIQEKGSSLLLTQLASFISLKTTNTKPWLSNPVRAKMRDR